MTTPDEHAREILAAIPGIPAPGDAPPADEGQDDAETGRRTWAPVDLTDVLEGRYQPPKPTVGARDDGVGLFYPGRMHSVAAESEAGKTWLMLAACATEMEAGNSAVYVDFEDDEGGIVGRLLALGTPPDLIRKHFAYIRPEVPLNSGDNRGDLAQALGDLRPTLVTLDGVTEGMVMHGLSPLDNSDVATFGRLLVRPVADHGAAVVTLDHVVKNSESRGRYALGAVHKLNGLNGAAYSLENRNPFGVGVTGQSGLIITKDRPGQLRRHAQNSAAGKWFADLIGESLDESSMDVAIKAPLDPANFRPTVLMGRVSEFLESYPGATTRQILDGVKGKSAAVRDAVQWLIKDEYVAVEQHGQSHRHTLIKPYADKTTEWINSLGGKP